jgi:uncharacterized protein (DUF1778 family)
MPTITFRVSEDERASFYEAAARSGLTVSDYIRRTFEFVEKQPDIEKHVADLDRRLARLEEMAGLA